MSRKIIILVVVLVITKCYNYVILCIYFQKIKINKVYEYTRIKINIFNLRIKVVT